MTTIEELISDLEKVVAVAEVLQTPLFNADWMLEASMIIKTQYPELAGDVDTTQLDSDIAFLKSGAEAALASITCKLLPDELAAYRDSQESRQRISDAQQICSKYSLYEDYYGTGRKIK